MAAKDQGYSQLTNLASNYEAITGRRNKALFLMQQGIAATSAIMNGLAGGVAALAPPPIGFGPVVGAVAGPVISGMGFANAAMIMAQAVQGVAHSGLDYVPETGTYLLKKGEFVGAPETTRALNQSIQRGGMGGGITITGGITVAVSGVTDAESFLKIPPARLADHMAGVIQHLARSERLQIAGGKLRVKT